MVPWEEIAEVLKAALIDLRSYQRQMIASDTHIRTIAADLKVHLQKHVDERLDTWRKYTPGEPRRLKVAVGLNRNHDGTTKQASFALVDALGELSNVLPGLVIHDPISKDCNLLAMETRDELKNHEFDQVVRCKRKILSLLGPTRYYAYGLFLRYARDGRLTEASLLRRSTLRERSSTLPREMLQRYEAALKHLKLSTRREHVSHAKAEVAEVERLLGVENVLGDICENGAVS